jgi:hypothetical protein
VRALRGLLATVVLTALLAGLGLMAPRSVSPAAAAAEPGSWVSIALTGISPALPARDGTLTLTGTVRNTSKVVLSNLQAIFWRSLDPIQGAEGMQLALASPANDPVGLRRPDVYQNIPAETDRALTPGGSTAFSLTVHMSQLTLPAVDAVYLVGVHVRGRTVAGGPDLTLGRARVFLPVVKTPPANAAQLTTLVLLSSQPSLVRKGVFADDHLADEVAPGGRLAALLQAADSPGGSFAVDPALIAELQTMRSGYSVLGADGKTTTPGAGQADAARWLADYAGVAARRDGYRLLYGNPDVAGLVHAGLTSVLTDGEAAARAVTATDSLPLLAMPAAGAADAQTMAALAALKPAAIVLTDVTTGESRPLLSGPHGIPLLNAAATTFGGGPGPDPQHTAVHIQQRLLAETWIQASTTAPGETIGQFRVIGAQAQARSGTKEVVAPWIRRESLSELLGSKPAAWSGRYLYPQTAARQQLSAAQLAGVKLLQTSFGAASDLLVEAGTVRADGRAACARSASASWRNRQVAWRRFVGPQQRALDDTLSSGVKIVVTQRVITSAHRGLSFPITIRNTLPPSSDPADPRIGAVRVQVDFTSANRQRLRVAPIGLQQVAAGDSVTDNAQVDAQSNGTVRVIARLYTTSGKPVGRAVPIDVKATQAGTTGWIIAIAAGIVLVGTSSLRIRQVARERSGTPTPPAATGPRHPAQVVPPPGTGKGQREPNHAAANQAAPPPSPPESPPGPREPSQPERLDV